jgi:hypothetical protein
MPASSNVSDTPGLNRRGFLKIAAGTAPFALVGIAPALAQEQEVQLFPQEAQAANLRPLRSSDIVDIQQLNSFYFFAIDALVEGDPAASWAATFTTTGTFSIVQNGQVLFQATGTQELISTYGTFPNVQTTRHWSNNLLIESSRGGAKSSCYVIAMDIGTLPATIIRSGIYRDELVKIRGNWKYQNRTLILDPNSPAG